MPEKTLNSILKTMSAVQARQISELLQKLQAAGSVRNAEEYSKKIEELSALINNNVPVPSFNQIKSLAWYLCSSDAHNIMMDSVKNDIESSFLQVDEIGEKVDDHSVLLMENLIKDLQNGLEKQEKTISRLEWLANQNNEFTSVLIDNFSSFAQTPRTAPNSSSLYYDNRTYQNVAAQEMPSAVISSHGNKLILPSEAESIVRPTEVVLHSDNYSYLSERNSGYQNKLENLIDGQKGTYWENNVYLKNKVSKVTTILEFKFGFSKDVNYLVIEGATANEFYIETIIGVLPDGHKVILKNETIVVDGKTRIDFQRRNLHSIIVTFSVKNFKKIESFAPVNSDALDFLSQKEVDNILVKNKLSSIIQEAMTTSELSNICNVPSSSSQQINAYLYSFGLDNVWCGSSVYQDSGIFVSKPLKITNPGVIAVNLKETEDTDVVKNNIENEIIKIDTFPRYKETRFPIPKLNQTAVSSERLLFQKRTSNSSINNVGFLRFFPLITSVLQPIVYKNNEPLNFNLGDWEYSVSELVSGETLFADWKNSFLNFSLEDYNSISVPLYFWIKINNPDLNGVYTVSYNIQTSDNSTTKTIWLDKDRSVYLGENGKVYFLKDPNITVESELYLQLTLRRNKTNRSSSPELNEYALLGAHY